eukprot:6189694-Pleurochrysis_carterae.AAC.3
MGEPLDLLRKDGTKHDKWFKAADRVSMIYGNQRFPGGVCAWLPSLMLLVGECTCKACQGRVRGLAIVQYAAPSQGRGPPENGNNRSALVDDSQGFDERFLRQFAGEDAPLTAARLRRVPQVAPDARLTHPDRRREQGKSCTNDGSGRCVRAA